MPERRRPASRRELQDQLRGDLEELVLEATSNRHREVRNCVTEVLFDLALANGLRAAKDGDDPNIPVFIGELAGLIADLKAKRG